MSLEGHTVVHQTYETVFSSMLADIAAEMLAVRREQTEHASTLWEIIDYQFGWDVVEDETGPTKNIAGKKMRPLLMALVAQAIRGTYQHVLPAGAALEMIHNFTLMHDDVMDKSLERRHRPTIWARWDSAQAINAGDGLYALAGLAHTRLLAHDIPAHKVIEVSRLLSQACLQTAEGQVLDMAFEARETITTAKYLKMIGLKSGSLLECAATIGALLSTDDETLIQAYTCFARNLGLAFQIRDDYLGIWGNEAQTGKSATGDIQEKKKSYPILVAFEQAEAADRDLLRRLYAQATLSTAQVETVLALLDRVDAATQTDQIMQQHYTTALQQLDRTGIENAAQDLIHQYATFLIQRTY